MGWLALSVGSATRAASTAGCGTRGFRCDRGECRCTVRLMSQPPNPQAPGYGASINLETARKVARVALAEAARNGWNVAVAIVDPAGELVYFERMDDTQIASAEVCQAKARTAARFKRPSKAFEDALSGGRLAILGLGATPVEGGIPITVDGKIIGAIGVSGVTSQQDGVCAQAGVDALGK
jgi:glc operon protein GlcG